MSLVSEGSSGLHKTRTSDCVLLEGIGREAAGGGGGGASAAGSSQEGITGFEDKGGRGPVGSVGALTGVGGV